MSDETKAADFASISPPPTTADGQATLPFQQHLTFAVQQNVTQSLIRADEIQALKAADPEAAALFYRVIEKQQDHDNLIELRTLTSESRYRVIGMVTALGVVVSLCAIVAVAIIYNHVVVATTIGGVASLSTVAGVFIHGRRLRIDLGSTDQKLRSAPEQGRPTHPPRPPRE